MHIIFRKKVDITFDFDIIISRSNKPSNPVGIKGDSKPLGREKMNAYIFQPFQGEGTGSASRIGMESHSTQAGAGDSSESLGFDQGTRQQARKEKC